tara:strand:+ start:346 stop:549 length:204 start_codon:yes stop_codon:yes gene_type:complete
MDEITLKFFDDINKSLVEYQKKELIILIISTLLTPISCKQVSKKLKNISYDLNNEWIESGGENQFIK